MGRWEAAEYIEGTQIFLNVTENLGMWPHTIFLPHVSLHVSMMGLASYNTALHPVGLQPPAEGWRLTLSHYSVPHPHPSFTFCLILSVAWLTLQEQCGFRDQCGWWKNTAFVLVEANVQGCLLWAGPGDQEDVNSHLAPWALNLGHKTLGKWLILCLLSFGEIWSFICYLWEFSPSEQ